MPECHVILTALYPGGRYISFSGTVHPRPEATRLELFTQLMAQLADSLGHEPQQLSPVFFSLEPNRLAPSEPVHAA